MTTVFPGLNPKYGLLTTARRGSGGAVQILYDSFTDSDGVVGYRVHGRNRVADYRERSNVIKEKS